MCSYLIKSIILDVASSKLSLKEKGRPRQDHGRLLDIFLLVLTSGMPWRAVTGVDFRTAHRHFIRWARQGVFADAYRRILSLTKRRRRDGTFMALDTTFVKNVFGTDTVGRNPTDRGRMATKLVALVDDRGLPRRLGFLPANVSDHRALSSILPLPRAASGTRVYADKGFDSKEARRVLKSQGYAPRIGKRGMPVPLWRERRRRVVERFFASLDKCRRLIVRYDATIVSYAAWTWLGCCRIAQRHVISPTERSR